jgi:tetratricopeptide (TPR) repeat protein
MYLNRYEEAIASFQKALSQRPDDVNLLEQMVICYEKTNLDPSVLVRRIERIKSGSDNEPN